MVSLGLLAMFPLPQQIKDAYGVQTAQQLADQIGVTKRPSLAMRAEATTAYEALQRGDQGPAMTMLTQSLGVSEQNAKEALAKLPAL
jgi:uncharacterized protein YidB (DUF937 family)